MSVRVGECAAGIDSSSGSIGVSVGTSGFGVTVSASAGRGKEAGDDLPPPFTNDPLGWRAAKKSNDQAPDEPERVKSEEDLPEP